MAQAGARNKTVLELEKVFHLTLKENALHQAYKMVLEKISTKIGLEIEIANSIWVRKGLSILDSYMEIIEMNYGSNLFEITTAQAINQWVGEKTNGRFSNIIQELDKELLLILINAIYFKGNWEIPFKEKLTKGDLFTLLTGEKIEVPTMHVEDHFYYYEGLNYQVLGMYYVGKNMSMIILLPRTNENFEEIEKNFSLKELDNVLKEAEKQKVKVYLPKFKFTMNYNLNNYLQSMGMIEAFKDKADFSGITKSMEIHIEWILHKAFVEVNEEGTEAAAVTSIIMLRTGLAPKPKPIPVFRADHPFIFLIRDLETKSILFMGRVSNPKIES